MTKITDVSLPLLCLGLGDELRVIWNGRNILKNYKDDPILLFRNAFLIHFFSNVKLYVHDFTKRFVYVNFA